MTSPLPTRQLLVAFQNNALDYVGGISFVASPGVLGGVNTWTDLSAYATSYQITRGRQHELSRFEPGHLIVRDLDNHDGRFNPWNTSSPYYGYLDTMKLVQIRDTWQGVTYTRFTGHIVAWPVKWPDAFTAWAEIEAYDALSFLALNDMISVGTSYRDTAVADAPRVYYRLCDSPAATVATDEMGLNNSSYPNGSSRGQAGALPTDLGTSTSLDGSTPCYISVPSAALLPNGSGAITVEAWVLLTNYDANGLGIVYQQLDATNDFVVAVGGSGQVLVSANFPALSEIVTGTVLTPGTWTHIVAVVPAATAPTGWKVYVNGASVSFSVFANNGAPNFTWSSPVGAWGANNASAGSTTLVGSFRGQLQDVALYTSALAAGTVLAHYNTGTGGLAGSGGAPQDSGAQISEALAVIGWNAFNDDINAGIESVQPPNAPLISTKVVAYTQTIEQTEAGAVYVSGNGKVTFRNRQRLGGTDTKIGTVQATFGDNPGEIAFEAEADPTLDELDIVNDVTVARVNGVTQRATDPTSPGKYGRRTQSLAGQLHTSDPAALAHAQWITNRLATPVDRLRQLKVNLVDLLAVPSQAASVLALELLYRVQVNRHGVPGGGSAFAQTALVEHLDERVTPESWDISFALSATDALGMWILDDTTFSVLGSTTRLGW